VTQTTATQIPRRILADCEAKSFPRLIHANDGINDTGYTHLEQWP